MPNQVIHYKLRRPNAAIPWAHEYIINDTSAELNDVRAHYLRYRQTDSRRVTIEYIVIDELNLDTQVTHFNTTPESVNHVELLWYRSILPDIKLWHDWCIQYNKMYGIIKTREDPYNTPDNSILNFGDYGRVEMFDLKFQTRR